MHAALCIRRVEQRGKSQTIFGGGPGILVSGSHAYHAYLGGNDMHAMAVTPGQVADWTSHRIVI